MTLYVAKTKKQKPNVPDQGPVHLLPDPRRGLTSFEASPQAQQPPAVRRHSKWLDPGALRGGLVIGITSAVIGGVIVCALYPVVAPMVVHLVTHLWTHAVTALL